MTPIILEGNTLGQRHQHYNRLVKEALASNKGETSDKISHEDNDIDNFLKIDIASHNRDVNYILEVLKCKDLLYVTRAIKKSRWLITDTNYSHIINPKYLHKELFPYMMQKAKSKLLLHIRLYLRDEKRVAQFYNYCKQFDVKLALKWLHYCPLQFALNEFHNHIDEISISRFKRFCHRSFEFLDKVAASSKRPDWYKKYYYTEVQFLIRHKTDKFLNYADILSEGYICFLKRKHFQFVMKTCPQRIFNDLKFFISLVSHTKLIKYTDKELIKKNLLKCSQQRDVTQKARSFEVLVKFLPKIEFSDRIEVLKAFYDTTSRKDWKTPCGVWRVHYFFYALNDYMRINILRVYRWFQCMPFDVAYREITSLIETSEETDERVTLIRILVKCTEGNLENIRTVLKYYHDTHVNELNQFKENFVDQILSCVAINKFDTEMWTLLDNLFCSMDVYKNSSSNTKYVETIIVYKIIHDQIIPEIIESKFKFQTLGYYKNKLNPEEREKLFIYLYERQIKNVENKTMTSEIEFKIIVKSLELTVQLMADWDKEITEFPKVFNKIIEFITIRKQKKWAWDIDLSTFYNIRKKWRRHFFDYSLILNPSKQVLLNVLKHNPNMLNMYQKEVASIRFDDPISLQLILSKIKIYWADTLAKEWISGYLFYLNDIGKQSMAIQSLAVLLSQTEFLDIVHKYIPEEDTINWKANEIEHGCGKSFAINIHRVRPLLDTDVLLWFAKGKYIKFAVTSLNAIFSNLSNVDREEYISNLTKVPMYLQKHGIHMAFMEFDKLIPILETIWKTTTNPTIRNSVFLTTHELLCKQSRKSKILKLWELLEYFIENLSDTEDVTIIQECGSLYKIPEMVKYEYFMKSYRYLKSLPKKHYTYAVNLITDYVDFVIEKCDRDFVEERILEGWNDGHYYSAELFFKYLLFIQDKEFELDTYDRLVKPKFLRLRDNLFKDLPFNVRYGVIKYKRVPVNLYKRLLNDFKRILKLPEDYVDLRTFELMTDFVEILQHHFSPKIDYSNDFDEVLKTPLLCDFAKACSKHLQRDIETFTRTIFTFEHVLDRMLYCFQIGTFHRLQIYKYMLVDQSKIEIYLLVHSMMPKNVYEGDEQSVKDEIISMLCSHPSKEIKMICQHCYRDKNNH
ncbi:hypothetical protein ABMA28_010243 [Loxostege sticticalis]|uniref:Uncharacterized protein n=1 Tax=Loxostege sticticalis TaxID=481309 RepID=A0ABD0SA69_LOXSC